MMLKLAIIGWGFVGKAVDYGFNNPKVEKCIIDPLLGTNISLLKSFVPDVTFVCVPTPMGEDGKINSSILDETVTYLEKNISGLIVVKSTVTPDIIREYGKSVVYNPEFLTEKSANEDFVNPIMHIFGGFYENTKVLEQIYQQYSNCKPCPVYHMTRKDASLVKYGINSYLASKVIWFNQFYDVVNAADGNFGKIVSAITTDARVGTSHTTVPGFDTRRGFGSACFSKDIPAFIKFAENIEQDFTILKEVWNSNCDYRNAYSDLLDREKEQHIKFKKIK